MNEEKHFKVGDRIKVSNNYHWAKNATGEISKLPFRFEDEEWTEDYYRDMQTLKGKVRCYWIKFDTTHFDTDGDGPYSGAEIESAYLELINLK
jgi:hypothetical protein